MRVNFIGKNNQKNFLKKVLVNTNCPSVKDFMQFGLDVNYSALKNYFSGLRLLPKDLFENMCHLAKIKKEELNFEYVSDNWGQVKGGKKSKRKKFK